MCTGVYHTKVYECVSMSVTVLCSCCSSAESEELTYLFWHSLFCWTLTLSRILRSWKTRPLLWILSLALLTHLFWRLAHSLFFPTSMWPKAAIQPRFLVLFIYIYTHTFRTWVRLRKLFQAISLASGVWKPRNFRAAGGFCHMRPAASVSAFWGELRRLGSSFWDIPGPESSDSLSHWSQ